VLLCPEQVGAVELMRILIINYEYPPVGGGAATATEGIAKQLVELGHRVVVLTGSYKGLPAFSMNQGVAVHRIPSLRKNLDRSGIFEMASFLGAGLLFAPGVIRKKAIDAAIVFFSLPCGPVGLLGRWMCGVPYVVSLRGGDVPGAEPSLGWMHWLLTPIRRAILRKSGAVVANSEGLKKMAEAVDPFPVRVIPNGVDAEFFSPAQSKSVRSEKVLRILFVGRCQQQKNLSFLLRQVAQLPSNSFELHLVGDGPQKESLERLAGELGIGAAVTWHGWLPRTALPDIYRSMDCLVNPSRYEGMANCVLEAMASGLPVIASHVPGNAGLVVSGETGFLFPLNDPAALTAALMQLHDLDFRSRLGKAARTRAQEFFSWRNVARQYAELFPDI
jgi:glycosyltransferase involved in cell wall biosynthesis